MPEAGKEDLIDPMTGLILKKNMGDDVQMGELLITFYSNQKIIKEIDDLIQDAYTYSIKKVKQEKMIEKEVF